MLRNNLRSQNFNTSTYIYTNNLPLFLSNITLESANGGMRVSTKQALGPTDIPLAIPANLTDVDLAHAVALHQPGAAKMADMPLEIPIINRRTGLFRRFVSEPRKKKKRVVSMPILSSYAKELPSPPKDAPEKAPRAVSMGHGTPSAGLLILSPQAAQQKLHDIGEEDELPWAQHPKPKHIIIDDDDIDSLFSDSTMTSGTSASSALNNEYAVTDSHRILDVVKTYIGAEPSVEPLDAYVSDTGSNADISSFQDSLFSLHCAESTSNRAVSAPGLQCSPHSSTSTVDTNKNLPQLPPQGLLAPQPSFSHLSMPNSRKDKATSRNLISNFSHLSTATGVSLHDAKQELQEAVRQRPISCVLDCARNYDYSKFPVSRAAKRAVTTTASFSTVSGGKSEKHRPVLLGMDPKDALASSRRPASATYQNELVLKPLEAKTSYEKPLKVLPYGRPPSTSKPANTNPYQRPTKTHTYESLVETGPYKNSLSSSHFELSVEHLGQKMGAPYLYPMAAKLQITCSSSKYPSSGNELLQPGGAYMGHYASLYVQPAYPGHENTMSYQSVDQYEPVQYYQSMDPYQSTATYQPVEHPQPVESHQTIPYHQSEVQQLPPSQPLFSRAYQELASYEKQRSLDPKKSYRSVSTPISSRSTAMPRLCSESVASRSALRISEKDKKAAIRSLSNHIKPSAESSNSQTSDRTPTKKDPLPALPKIPSSRLLSGGITPKLKSAFSSPTINPLAMLPKAESTESLKKSITAFLKEMQQPVKAEKPVPKFVVKNKAALPSLLSDSAGARRFPSHYKDLPPSPMEISERQNRFSR